MGETRQTIDRAAPRSSAEALFAASSVAVVGASPRPGNLGGVVIQSLRAGAAAERTFSAVGPAAMEIAGVRSAGSLSELDHVPDVVVVAVGTERVLPVIREAGELGVRGAVIFAGGFAEAGPAGRDLQAELQAVSAEHSIAVLGPNCQGLVNFVTGLPLYSDIVDRYQPGNVALISQSGSVTTALINNKRGVRWSHAVSSGNEAVLDAADLLDYYIGASEVRVICAFLETIRRPERFFALCRRAYDAGKAVVVCKTGRTRAAQAAAAAHSGALSSPDRLINALFRRNRVIRTESLSELLETAKAIGTGARPRGGRAAAISGSGGHIALLHDQAEGTKLTFPAFGPDTQRQLGPLLGSGGRVVVNPIDYWGAPNLDQALPEALGILAADPDLDVLMAISDFSTGPTGRGPRAHRLLAAWERLDERPGRSLMLIDAVGGTPAPEVIEAARECDLLVLSELGAGLKAIEHLIEFAAVGAPADDSTMVITRDQVEAILAEATPGINSGELPLRLIEAAGIRTVPTITFGSDEPLPGQCLGFGFPLVAKVADPSIAHREAAGGVVLGIGSRDELISAVERLRAIGDGSVMIQPQLASGVELLAGLHCDSDLGTFVLIGAGGTGTEAIADVAISPVGLRRGEAEMLLDELSSHAVVAATSEAGGRAGIVEIISRLDHLGRLLDRRVQSLDINPLLITPGGWVAVDALLVV